MLRKRKTQIFPKSSCVYNNFWVNRVKWTKYTLQNETACHFAPEKCCPTGRRRSPDRLCQAVAPGMYEKYLSTIESSMLLVGGWTGCFPTHLKHSENGSFPQVSGGEKKYSKPPPTPTCSLWFITPVKPPCILCSAHFLGLITNSTYTKNSGM